MSLCAAAMLALALYAEASLGWLLMFVLALFVKVGGAMLPIQKGDGGI